LRPLWDELSRIRLNGPARTPWAIDQNVAFARLCPFVQGSEALAKQLLLCNSDRNPRRVHKRRGKQ